MGNQQERPLLQLSQVDSQKFPQLFDEGHVQRDPTQGVEHTEDLA